MCFQGNVSTVKIIFMVTATPVELLFSYPSAEPRIIRKGAQYEVRREKNRLRGSTTVFFWSSQHPKARKRHYPAAASHCHAISLCPVIPYCHGLGIIPVSYPRILLMCDKEVIEV